VREVNVVKCLTWVIQVMAQGGHHASQHLQLINKFGPIHLVEEDKASMADIGGMVEVVIGIVVPCHVVLHPRHQIPEGSGGEVEDIRQLETVKQCPAERVQLMAL